MEYSLKYIRTNLSPENDLAIVTLTTDLPKWVWQKAFDVPEKVLDGAYLSGDLTVFQDINSEMKVFYWRSKTNGQENFYIGETYYCYNRKDFMEVLLELEASFPNLIDHILQQAEF